MSFIAVFLLLAAVMHSTGASQPVYKELTIGDPPYETQGYLIALDESVTVSTMQQKCLDMNGYPIAPGTTAEYNTIKAEIETNTITEATVVPTNIVEFGTNQVVVKPISLTIKGLIAEQEPPLSLEHVFAQNGLIRMAFQQNPHRTSEVIPTFQQPTFFAEKVLSTACKGY